ncbi:MAG: XrtA/PEP-CTERM system histidine kinase PrsK [Alcanivoracaceae bacterium]
MPDTLLLQLLMVPALFWLIPLWRARLIGAGHPLRVLLPVLSISQLLWLATLTRPEHWPAPLWLMLNHASEALRLAVWWWLLAALATLTGIRFSHETGTTRKLFIVALLVTVYAGAAAWTGLPGLRSVIPYTALVLAPLMLLVAAEQLYRSASSEARWTLKFPLLALAVLCVTEILTHGFALLHQRPHPDLWMARAPVSVISAVLLLTGLRRVLRMPRGVSLSHQMAFYTGTLTLAGLALIITALGAWYIRDGGGRWSTVATIVFLAGVATMLVSVALSGRFRARLKVFLSRHFLPYRYDHRVEWLRLSDRLATGVASQTLPEQVIRAIADIVDSPAGLLLMRRQQKLECVASFNMPVTASLAPSAVTMAELDRQWILDRHQPGVLPEWLSGLPRAWLAVPLTDGERCIAVVIIADARAPRSLNWEDYDLLRAAARHAGAVIAQQQSSDALARAQQFAALHQSTAFLAHDLKTMVAQLSLLARNADKHRHNPDFIDDMLDTVRHSVIKLDHILTQLRQPPDADQAVPMAVAVHPLLADTCARLSRFNPAPVLMPYEEDIHVLATPDALESVFSHLIRNAQEACADSGSVTITTAIEDNLAVVRITDSGHGMSQEFIRDHLFAPFHSTKGVSGMGIGAFQSRALIEALGGSLNAESRLGTGSCFTIRLPRH